jgi:hypothetical protein
VPLELGSKLEENFAHWADLRAAAGWPMDLGQLHDVLDGICNFYCPTGLYLFGSLAHSTFDVNSDIDLLIVVPDDAEPSRLSQGSVVEAQFRHGLPLDAFVMKQTQFNERRTWLDGLASEAAGSGVLLNAA